jgi:uncharacterized damage-inducible protein DinB
MPRELLDQMISDLGQSFDMLFANLKDLHDDDWSWLPDGGVRSIRALVGHVASCKVMYDNHAFGDASMSWDDPRLEEAQSPSSDDDFAPALLIDWLRESQLHLLKSIDALTDDAELMRPRPVNWGGNRKTKWIIGTLIRHDVFHAGEINHLRALHQRNDGWEWEE